MVYYALINQASINLTLTLCQLRQKMHHIKSYRIQSENFTQIKNSTYQNKIKSMRKVEYLKDKSYQRQSGSIKKDKTPAKKSATLIKDKNQSRKKKSNQSIFNDKTLYLGDRLPLVNPKKNNNQMHRKPIITFNPYKKPQKKSASKDSFSNSKSKQKDKLKYKHKQKHAKMPPKDIESPTKNKKLHTETQARIQGQTQYIKYSFIVNTEKVQSQVTISSPYLNNFLTINEMQKSAKKLMKQGKFAMAKSILDQVLLFNPKSMAANINLAQIYAHQKMFQKSHQCYKKCLQVNKNDFKSLYRKAVCLFELEEFENAIKVLNLMLKIPGHHQKVHEKKGYCQLGIFDFQGALESFNKALQLGSKNYQMYGKIADIYNHYSMFQNAVKFYDKYLNQYNEYEQEIIQKKAQCLAKATRHRESIDSYQKLEKVASKPSLNPMLLKSLVADSQYSKAFQEHKKLKEADIKFPQLEEQEYLKLIKGLNENGQQNQAKQIVNVFIERKNPLKGLQMRAKINLEMGLYDDCQDDIKLAIQRMQLAKVPMMNLLITSTTQSQVLVGLMNMMRKLQEINAYSLTQSQDQYIINRRKLCLNQALRLFQSHDQRELSIIMEESVSLHESLTSAYMVEQNSVFQLRNIQKIMRNWTQHNFDISSLIRTADIAFDMIQSDMDDFSIMPTHIVTAMMKSQTQFKFRELNQNIIAVLEVLCKKYPPTEVQMTKSKIRSTKTIQSFKRQNFDQFGRRTVFNNYRQIYKAVEDLTKKAKKEIQILDMITKQVCYECEGVGYKSGLKLPITNQGLQQRILCRIIEKLLKDDLKNCKEQFYEKIEISQFSSLNQYLSVMQRVWEEIIQKILAEKMNKKYHTPCYVYDFMRAKCMFSDIDNLQRACENFIQKDKLGHIRIIQLQNRLDFKTRDIVFKVRFRQVVGEIQFALKFEAAKNQFNHSLYELHRSPFGPCFSSVMWLSGYARKNKKLMIKQKLKWNLKGLNHLKKFIYADKLEIIFPNHQELVQLQFGRIFLIDFMIEKSRIRGNIMNSHGKYLKFGPIKGSFDGSQFGSIKLEDEPLQIDDQVEFILVKETFLTNQDYSVAIREVGSFNYLNVQNKHFVWKQMKENQIIQNLTFKVKFCDDETVDYVQRIKNAIQSQKDVIKNMGF